MISDLERQLAGWELVVLRVFYHMPDYRSLLQEFTWQFIDRPPSFERTKAFLDHWHREIEAPINRVEMSRQRLIAPGVYQPVGGIYSLH